MIPTIRVKIGENELHMLIDTGSSRSFTVTEIVIGSLPTYKHTVETTSTVLGEYLQGRSVRLATTGWIGKHKVQEPIARWHEGQRMHLTVGCQILRHFAITFDSSSQVVRLASQDDFPIRNPGNLRSIGARFTAHEMLSVDKIVPDGPASCADLRIGDHIYKINGQPVRELSPES